MLSRPTSTEGRINGVNVMTGADDNARIECRNGFKLESTVVELEVAEERTWPEEISDQC